jgi:hypothetical protein
MGKSAATYLRNIPIAKIQGYHPAVRTLSASLSERVYALRLDVLTDEAIQRLLRLHPVQVVLVAGDYQVVAGFRSYQLAISRPDVIDKIPVIEYSNILESEVIDLAQIDILGSVLMHSLGTKSAEQLGMISDKIGKDATKMIAPSLSSIRARRKFEQAQ